MRAGRGGRATVATTLALAALVLTGAVLRVEAVRDSASASELVMSDPVAAGLPAFFAYDVPDPDDAEDDVDDPVDDDLPLDEDRAAFEARFPRQAAAPPITVGRGDDRWALLIGINVHLGSVADNTASREDAQRLEALLVRAGWDPDHVVLLTDTDATGAMIREGLAWLERKTGPASNVVFHYSGHSKKDYGAGGTIVDQHLWPTDDDFVSRDQLGTALGRVQHAAFWGNVAACEAAGFHVEGVAGTDRVWTYSSGADEKSYEDPDAGHSVWGAFLLDHGLWRAGERPPPIQEVFDTAAAQAREYTSLQVPYGPQTPVLVDDLGAPFDVAAPAGRVTPSLG